MKIREKKVIEGNVCEWKRWDWMKKMYMGRKCKIGWERWIWWKRWVSRYLWM